MDGFDIDLATYKMGDDPAFDEEVRRMTPGERVALTCEMSKAAWMRETGSVDEPVFRRDIVRVIRPGSNGVVDETAGPAKPA